MPMPTEEPKATSDIKMTNEWRDMNNHGTVSTVSPLPSRILAHSHPTLDHRNNVKRQQQQQITTSDVMDRALLIQRDNNNNKQKHQM